MARKQQSKSSTDYTLTKRMAKKFGMSNEMLSLIIEQVPEGVSDKEVALFLYQVDRTGLDPLSRQIYLVARWDNREKRNVGTPQTGIDGYRLIAERTGKYAGSSDPIFNGNKTQYEHKLSDDEFPVTATITIKKALDNGGVGEFTATAEWDAYYPGDRQGFMWKKMPYVMLSKCAEALALRKAFPAELSGVYTAEEMAQAGGVDDEVVVAEMMEELGVENENALKVMEKLDDCELSDEQMQLLVETIETPLESVPDTADGNKILYAVWAFAVAIKKGMSFDEALKQLGEELE